MRAVFIFIRSAGISQRTASQVNSAHFDPINSLVRMKARATSFMARRVTGFPLKSLLPEGSEAIALNPHWHMSPCDAILARRWDGFCSAGLRFE